jgi:hypothetical protein
MGKPTLRRFKPGELGGGIVGKVIDFGFQVGLANAGLARVMGKAGVNTYIGELGAGTYGLFTPDGPDGKPSIVLDRKLINKQTALHEGGHGIDSKNNWISDTKDSPFRTGGSNEATTEMQQVLVHRFNRYVVPSENISQYAALKRRLSGGYFSYMNSTKERFAEGYSQWQTNPRSFATYAPTLATWFRSNAPKL